MPPKIKITKSEIVDTAVDLVRRDGEQAINARSIANVLNCSTQPVFSNFATMNDLREAVKEAANALYETYLETDMTSGKYLPYKASGMAYIRFAREEKELFKLLFMRDRSKEEKKDEREAIRPLLEIIQKNLGVKEEEAFFFHMEMWIYVHGIATMIATSYMELDEALISEALTDAYEGLKYRYTEGKNHVRHQN